MNQPVRKNLHASASKELGDTLPAVETSVVRGLSGKLLVLTVLFVLFAEVLIFIPSMANFRNVWLQGRLDTAEAASIVFLDNTDIMLSADAQRNLLDATQSLAVAVRDMGQSTLMATERVTFDLSEQINLDQPSVLGSVSSALGFLFSSGDRQYRVFGKMKSREAIIELVQDDKHLVAALRQYSINVLLISLVISLITAALVFFALYRMIVRPIRNISQNMTDFSRTPEDADLIFKPTGRNDEIGVAENRLASFQVDLQNTLRQKQHLADLGLAVSKINHDLRNILASASLFSDRLSTLPDPTVQRFAPRMIKAIDRAVEYTKSVIDYGKAVEAPSAKRAMALSAVVNDVEELLGLDHTDSIVFENKIDPDCVVNADPEQMFRVIMNICRNAVQAMRADEEEGGNLTVSASQTADHTTIMVADTGPGIAPLAAEKLFEAFQGSTKSGGSGLGMAIAAELMMNHGGTIEIAETGPEGTVIRLTLPNGEFESLLDA